MKWTKGTTYLHTKIPPDFRHAKTLLAKQKKVKTLSNPTLSYILFVAFFYFWVALVLSITCIVAISFAADNSVKGGQITISTSDPENLSDIFFILFRLDYIIFLD